MGYEGKNKGKREMQEHAFRRGIHGIWYTFIISRTLASPIVSDLLCWVVGDDVVVGIGWRCEGKEMGDSTAWPLAMPVIKITIRYNC